MSKNAPFQLGNNSHFNSSATTGKYFEETKKNYEKVMSRLEFQRKALPLEKRILLAEEIIGSGKCKSIAEVEEVQKILIDLKKQFELVALGFKYEESPFSKEEIEEYKATYLKELKVAEAAYKKQLDKMRSLTDKYVSEMSGLISEASRLDALNSKFDSWDFARAVGIDQYSQVIKQPSDIKHFNYWQQYLNTVKMLKLYIGGE